MAAAMPDAVAADAHSVLVPCVNLFHANAWGVPYVAAMTGSRLVLLGPHVDPPTIYAMPRDERGTHAFDVPTIWTNLFRHIDSHDLDPHSDWCPRHVPVGGATMPRFMTERFAACGVCAGQAWDLTETSQLGVMGRLLPKHGTLPIDRRLDVQSKQGRAIWGVELKVVNPGGKSPPARRQSFRSPHGARSMDRETVFQGGSRRNRCRRLVRYRRCRHH